MSSPQRALDDLIVELREQPSDDGGCALTGAMRFAKALEGPPGRLHGGYHAHVRTLPINVTPAHAEAVAADSFSRFPIRDAEDQLVGYVHIKDLLENDPQARRKPMDPRHVRPLPSVRVTDSLREVMVQMQRTNAHLAVVLEADAEAPAEPLGIVTLEDVLEELVGKIRDDSRRATGRRGNSEQAS